MPRKKSIRSEFYRLNRDYGPMINDDKLFRRFLIKVVFTPRCWEWSGTKFSNGYGRFRVNGVDSKAHRVARELFSGPIEGGGIVCHTCDNPGCVNPAHLWVGTPADNMADKVAKGRAHGAHRGEAHHNAKLTENDVRKIRADPRPQREIAAEYGLAQQTVSDIKHRKYWVWLEGEENGFRHRHLDWGLHR